MSGPNHASVGRACGWIPIVCALAACSGSNVKAESYCENWADPGNQIIPEDWRGATSITQLAGYAQTYTQNIVSAMVTAGARPDIGIGEGVIGVMINTTPSNFQPAIVGFSGLSSTCQ